MKTWHAAVASLGTAAFLVAAYIAVLSVSGALFAFTDLSRAGTAKQAPPLKTVVAVKPVKVKPVVARVPKPEPEPVAEPAALPVQPTLAAAVPSSSGADGSGSADGGDPLARHDNPPVDDTNRTDLPDFGGDNGEDRDDAALVSKDGVNVSGPARNVTDNVNDALKERTGIDLRQVTDPVEKAVDHVERTLGLDRQGR